MALTTPCEFSIPSNDKTSITTELTAFPALTRLDLASNRIWKLPGFFDKTAPSRRIDTRTH